MTFAVRPVGDAAFLVDVDPGQRHAVARAIAERGLAGVIDVVPAERSVLVTFDPRTFDATGADAEVLADLASSAIYDGLREASAMAAAVEIEVRYDGADLDDVAALTGLSTRDVVARHLAGDYVVAFMGFAPGFGYLDGLDAALHVPRLATPRTRVDAGAVAIAGARSCIYPGASPGGWRVVGHTRDVLFDASADMPSLLQVGVRVRFREA
ncbi:MAG TPA: allophanate hydrolase subunit 1 [Acidothermaceae bacterium]